MMTPVHDNSKLVLSRVARFVRERLTPALYRERRPLDIRAWAAPGEPVPFAEAVGQEFAPVRGRDGVGPAVGHRLVPRHRLGAGGLDRPATRPELVVDLGFTGGQPGLPGRGPGLRARTARCSAASSRNAATSRCRAAPGRPSSSTRGGGEPGRGRRLGVPADPAGRPGDRGAAPLYRLRAIDVGLLDVAGLGAAAGRLDAARAGRASCRRTCRGGPRSCARWSARSTRSTRTTWPAPRRAGRAELAAVLASPALRRARTGSRGRARAHRLGLAVAAAGDGAQGGPHLRQRGRRCRSRTTRSWCSPRPRRSSTPGCSEHYPALFERVRAQVAAGRFVPVGGMWVESDTNMPGGEALARQFVARQAVLPRGVRRRAAEVWLPDSFGYSAALPQIIAAGRVRAGSSPRRSPGTRRTCCRTTPSAWEGIDGTRIFTHFPPVDTYNAQLSGAELARAQRRFAEKGAGQHARWCRSAGATAAAGRPGRCWPRPPGPVAWRARRRCGSTTPAEFFAAAEAEYPQPPVWSGRAVPGAPPRHLHQPGADQAGQPAQRTPAARGRAVGGHGRRAHRRRVPVRGAGPAAGRRCCCTSSTTSCPAPRSPGCTAGRARVRAGRGRAGGDHRGRAGRARPGRGQRAGLQRRPVRGGRGARRSGRGRPARPRRLADRRRDAPTALVLDNGRDPGGDRRPRPGHLGPRPARTAASCSPRTPRPTCCSCTGTPRPAGTPGTSTSTTGTTGATWSSSTR